MEQIFSEVTELPSIFQNNDGVGIRVISETKAHYDRSLGVLVIDHNVHSDGEVDSSRRELRSFATLEQAIRYVVSSTDEWLDEMTKYTGKFKHGFHPFDS